MKRPLSIAKKKKTGLPGKYADLSEYVFLSGLFRFLITPAHSQNCPRSGRADNDACTGRAGMNNLSAAYINAHMPRIAYDIPRLRLRIGNPGAGAPHGIGGSGQTVAEILINSPHKTRAVSPLRQACPARHIRISDKLAGIIGNLLPLAPRTRIAGRRRVALGGTASGRAS